MNVAIAAGLLELTGIHTLQKKATFLKGSIKTVTPHSAAACLAVENRNGLLQSQTDESVRQTERI